jgi:hypothetical protein
VPVVVLLRTLLLRTMPVMVTFRTMILRILLLRTLPAAALLQTVPVVVLLRTLLLRTMPAAALVRFGLRTVAWLIPKNSWMSLNDRMSSFQVCLRQ